MGPLWNVIDQERKIDALGYCLEVMIMSFIGRSEVVWWRGYDAINSGFLCV